jgi:hypothetical protein
MKTHSFPGAVLVIAAAFAPAASGAEPQPKNLTGRWYTGRLSNIQYRDSITGVDRPPAGNHFAYEFRPDGTYTFTGTIQSTVYNCTTTMFGEESGAYEVTGVELALHPVKNPFRMTNSCAPSSNRQGPGKLVERSFRFAINGDQLELTSAADRAVSTFQRAGK